MLNSATDYLTLSVLTLMCTDLQLALVDLELANLVGLKSEVEKVQSVQKVQVREKSAEAE